MQHNALTTLWVGAAMVIGVGIVQGLLTGLSGFQAEWVSQKVAYRLRLDYFRQLQRLSFGFHDKIHSGDLITRGMIDLEGTRMFIQNGMMMSLTLVLLVVVATWMMFAADPIMALLALAFVPVSIFTLARVGFLLRLAWMRVQTLMSVLTLTMEENLQGIRVVRSFAVAHFRAGQVRQGGQRGAAPGLPAHHPAHARHAHHDARLLLLAWRWCSGTAATRSPPAR